MTESHTNFAAMNYMYRVSAFGFRLTIALPIWMTILSTASVAQPSAAAPKIYTGPDGITEEFGGREAPYEGFLVLPKSVLPDGYNETKHHYTKTEYLITFKKQVGDTSYDIDVTESSVVKFFEPSKYEVAQEFTLSGRIGHVLSYRSHSTNRPALVLYWLNPPKQRLSITVDVDTSHPLSPDDLINLLVAMKPAVDVPALVTPFPKPTTGWP